MSSYLVTGAAGFLGSHMVDHLLARGAEVFGVDSLQAGKRENLAVSPNFHFVENDIRDRSWWSAIPERLDGIFHMAANASVPVSTEDPIFDTTTNVVGTTQILEMARTRKARVVFISSAAVYGNPERLPTGEDHPLRPISIYGVTKLAGEGLVRFYRDNHGVPTQTIRYFNCFGPRQPRYILFDYLKKAESPEGPFVVLGDGTQRRTQLYATDAARATFLVFEKGDGEPYNIGSDQVHSVTEIAQKILKVTGQSERPITYSGASWPGDIKVLQPSLTRLRGLGFAPEISLEEGISQLYQWWRQAKR